VGHHGIGLLGPGDKKRQRLAPGLAALAGSGGNPVISSAWFSSTGNRVDIWLRVVRNGTKNSTAANSMQ